MDQLPEKWCIRANSHEEAKVIAEYLTPLSIEGGWDPWNEEDALSYYARIKYGKYDGGNKEILVDFIDISFSDFTKLVLNKQVEPNYEIY